MKQEACIKHTRYVMSVKDVLDKLGLATDSHATITIIQSNRNLHVGNMNRHDVNDIVIITTEISLQPKDGNAPQPLPE